MQIDGVDHADGVIHLIDDGVERRVDIQCQILHLQSGNPASNVRDRTEERGCID